MEYRYNNRDYLSRGIPVTDDQGPVGAVLVLSYDITERKRLEEALRESEYRFRTMANGTPMMIWVTDADGDLEFINQAYTDFLASPSNRPRTSAGKCLFTRTMKEDI